MPDANPYDPPSVEGIRGNCTSDSFVEYEYTLFDAMQFSLRENRPHQETNIRNARMLLIAIGSLVLLLATGIYTRTPAGLIPFAALAIGSLFFFVTAIRIRGRTEKRMRHVLRQMLGRRSSHGVFGHRSLRIAEDGIFSTFPAGQSTWQWWAVSEIVSDQEYLYLYIAAVEAHIIPARAFASPEHFEAFAANALRLWEQRKKSAQTS